MLTYDYSMKETCNLLTSSYSVRSWNQYTTAIDVNNAEIGEWSSMALFLGWRRTQEMVALRACRACRRTCTATPPGNTPWSLECRAAAPRARVGTGCIRRTCLYTVEGPTLARRPQAASASPPPPPPPPPPAVRSPGLS